MCVGQTSAQITRFQIGVIGKNSFLLSPWASRLRNLSTEIRIPRMIGLPPKISGFAVIRPSSFSSIMLPDDTPAHGRLTTAFPFIQSPPFLRGWVRVRGLAYKAEPPAVAGGQAKGRLRAD